MPAPPLPEPLPKPEPPKPEPPKPSTKPEPPKPQDKPKQKQDQDFDQLLKNLTKTPVTAQKSDQPPKPQKQQATQVASAQPDAPLGAQLSTSEKDLIAAAVEQCWGIDAGERGIAGMRAVVRVELNPDGSVRTTSIVDTEGRMSDPAWRAFAERAARAPLIPKCNKLPIDPDKIDQMQTFTFTFTPQGVS